MRILIIEDELPARAKLSKMLKELRPDAEIAGEAGSVKEAENWLKQNPAPDLAFVDIHLSDSHSFELFRETEISFPVVFTTAYDQYILESFAYNSIDYLLKPITADKLARTLLKVSKLKQHFSQGGFDTLLQPKTGKTQRIVARKGTDFVAIELVDVAYFFTEHKVVFVRDFTGRKLIVDKTLAELEETIEGDAFFRLNRKYIANMKAIAKFKPDSGKILVNLYPPMQEDIHVSKETAPLFRTWIGKK